MRRVIFTAAAGTSFSRILDARQAHWHAAAPHLSGSRSFLNDTGSVDATEGIHMESE